MGSTTTRSRGVRGGGWLIAAALAISLAAQAPARPEPTAAPGGPPWPEDSLLERPGSALRDALEAARNGRIAEADALLQALGERQPVIADYADFYRMRLDLDAGETEEAIAIGKGWPHPDSPLRSEVLDLLGRAYADRGEEQQARAAWEQALALLDEGDRRAEARFEIGRSYLRVHQPEQAAEAFLEIWTREPLSGSAAESERNLAALEGQLGRTLRSADRYRRRGDVLFRQRHNEEALAAYEKALALGTLSPAQQRRARTQRAHTLFRMRRYTEATQAFAALPQDAENRIAGARSLARAGDVPAAAAELERIGREVQGQQGLRAKLLAALLWDDEEGGQQRARKLFAALAEGAASTSYGAAAQWRLGWGAYREGHYAEAVARLGALRERRTDPIDGLQARYWYARAAEHTGVDASEDFGAIAREFPLSYYGWRASARAAQGASRAPPRAMERGISRLSPGKLARPRILLEAGLADEAQRELGRLFIEAAGLEDRLALAELYANAGDFHRAQRLMVDEYRQTLARGPGPGPVELWWYAWPLPFVEAVREATASRGSLDPALVYAVMREESGYRPTVRSVAGARGLLQLMPETAERVANRVALADFSPDDLFLPHINILLGSAYLEELLARFSGRASAAVGSYNAGPHRVVRWLEGADGDDDEWVEGIPYEQTRNYVKRVLRSAHAYRVLY